MNYVVAKGLLASNWLIAMQGASPRRSRATQATSVTRAIDWLSDTSSKGTRYGKYTNRIA
jgi:hypothetical protein